MTAPCTSCEREIVEEAALHYLDFNSLEMPAEIVEEEFRELDELAIGMGDDLLGQPLLAYIIPTFPLNA